MNNISTITKYGITMHFGMNALYLYCERTGTKLLNYSEAFERADSLREMCYCGYVAHCRESKQEQELDVYDIGSMLDQIALPEISEIMKAMAEGWMRWGQKADEGTPGNVQEPGV